MADDDERLARIADRKPDMTEARIARLETRLDHIDGTISEMKVDIREMRNTDIRELRNKVDQHFILGIGALIATAVGLAGLTAKGFHWF
jgi:hypothetical protein